VFSSSAEGNGGGGGGWYGGGAKTDANTGIGQTIPGGGGSGYISGMANCDTTYRVQQKFPGASNPVAFVSGSMVLKIGSESFPSPGGGNETGHAGSGYVRICDE
jgi:hypothetical protein